MYGVSYATYFCNDIERLKCYNGTAILIEIPCYEITEVIQIVDLCKKKNLKYGFHYPSFASYNRVGYILSNNVYSDILQYKFLSDEAEYFVFHFPGEYDIPFTFQDILDSFAVINNATKDFQCEVLVENLSKYSIFGDVEHYKAILKHSHMNLCLDIGHAHMITNEDLFRFIDVLQSYIIVVHYYNTSNNPDSPYYGKHLKPSYMPVNSDPNFIDLIKVNKLLSTLPNLLYIVDESYQDIY